ncbi:MAG TPA: DedA family protein [Gaiellaceae bacterium]|nr:DedA family protein [Gaiellaceae bacterium]
MPVASVTQSVTHFVAVHGVYAVFALMALDAVFPAASELVMVYGGALAAGAFSGRRLAVFGSGVGSHPAAYAAVVAAGTIGYLAGSLAGWAVGRWLGRGFVERHGTALHLGPARLARADQWLARHGRLAVFLGRLTPVVRSFVSIPAGVAGIPIGPYAALTLAGSALWCVVFAAVGWGLGSGYHRFHHAFDLVSVAIVAVVLALLAAIVGRRRRRQSR